MFRAHRIGYFFYNGGNDSADTCLKVAQLGGALDWPLRVIHVPKTIDNDLPLTDCCPGYGSVARYEAVSTREASLDVRSMASTSTRVFVLEVMGRHAGWIAAAAALASDRRLPLPLVILLPEVPFDAARFLAAVRERVAQHGYCTVVVSEGVQTADGRFLADRQDQVLLVRDPHLAETVALRQIRNPIKLGIGDVPGHNARRLERQHHRAITRHPVRLDAA